MAKGSSLPGWPVTSGLQAASDLSCYLAAWWANSNHSYCC